jgi:hypothetical protein
MTLDTDTVAQYLLDAFSPLNNDTADPFCTSEEGMIMYMDGFRLSLSSSSANNNNPCLNFYFPEWTLNTRSKFWWAMLGTIALGVVTEGISKLRSTLSKKLKGNVKRWSITVLHGLQALVGYILMLCTMTFSVELLFCVIFGLALGFAIFYDEDGLHVTTNPCCNFIQVRTYSTFFGTALFQNSRIILTYGTYIHTYIHTFASFYYNNTRTGGIL